MELGPKYVDLIHRAAMIHDVGRIGIPDVILLKPDHLTLHERMPHSVRQENEGNMTATIGLARSLSAMGACVES